MSASPVYDREKRAWVPLCPHGDVCSGCDARGYCTREEGEDGLHDPAPLDLAPIADRSIGVRRIGSGKVHRAVVALTDLYPATHWGAPCTWVQLDSVATLCGVVLRGSGIIEIPEGDALDSWRRDRKVCIACERVAAALGEGE